MDTLNFYDEEIEKIVRQLETDQSFRLQLMNEQLKFLRTFRKTYTTNLRQHEIMLVLIRAYLNWRKSASAQAVVNQLTELEDE